MVIFISAIVVFLIGATILLFYRAQKEVDVTKVVHYPGIAIGFRYGFIPILPWIARKSLTKTWYCLFTDKAYYDHGNDNNHDWNKGGGDSFDWLSNHVDSCMWAWRINQKKQLVEFTAYCHVDGNRVIAKKKNSEVIYSHSITAPQLIQITRRIDYDKKLYSFTWSMYEPNSKPVALASVEVPFNHSKRVKKTISPFFKTDTKLSKAIAFFMQKS